MPLYPTCEEAASHYALEKLGCFDTVALCKYCVGTGLGDMDECILEAPRGPHDKQMCNGATFGLPRRVFRQSQDYPTVLISYPPGSTDAEGSTTPKHVGYHMSADGRRYIDTTWEYFLRETPMLFDPCGSNPQNCTSGRAPRWCCRWYAVGGRSTIYDTDIGWEMHCTQPITGPGPGDAQLAPRPFAIKINPYTREPLFIRWSLGGLGYCFDQQDQFCFSWKCEDDPTWSCLGPHVDGYVVPALDWLHLDVTGIGFNTANIQPGQAFPHKVPEAIHLKNAALRTMAVLVTSLGTTESPSHTRVAHFDDPRLYRWSSGQGFGVGDPPVFPVVKDARLDEVVLTAVECRSKVAFPARLTLTRVRMTLHAHVEARSGLVPGDDQAIRYRVHGSFDLHLELGVRLEHAAYAIAAAGGLQFLNPDDPYDLRLKDWQTGEAHLHRKLLVSGPAGCAVPRKIRWEGLQASHPYSRGSDSYQAVCRTYSGSPCCETLQALEALTVMFGRLNDHSETTDEFGMVIARPQRYVGAVTVEVPRLNTGGTFHCRCVN